MVTNFSNILSQLAFGFMLSAFMSKSSSSSTVGFSIFIIGSLTEARFPLIPFSTQKKKKKGVFSLHYWHIPFLSLQVVGTLDFPYNHRFSKRFRTGWSFFPPNLLTKALWLLSDATSSPRDAGISWRRISECSPNDADCLITIVCKKIWRNIYITSSCSTYWYMSLNFMLYRMIFFGGLWPHSFSGLYWQSTWTTFSPMNTV